MHSVEDKGEGICFNVYCYNVQPGVTINYATGSSTGPIEENNASSSSTPSATIPTPAPEPEVSADNDTQMVWLPNSGSKYHSYAGCSNMNNPRQVSKEEAERLDCEPCKKCW